MFTGIVEDLGEVVSLTPQGDHAARVTIRSALITADAAHGDSIAVNGICLTVVDLAAEAITADTNTADTNAADTNAADTNTPDTFTADIMAETLHRTTAGHWRPGERVNLERSVTPTTRLGGHLVQGHIDGVGTLTARTENPGYDDVAVAVPRPIGRYLAPQGAVTVDGISLTVINVTDEPERVVFTLGVIPETRTATTMGLRAVGDTVNIEADVMAKYAERLLAPHGAPHASRQEAGQ